MKRPWPSTAMAVFCGATVFFLVYRDLALPHVRDVEIWLGFELHGLWAQVTAPLHWALFAVAGVAFLRDRDWAWRLAIPYSVYVALSHVVWNLVSPRGGGASDAAWQGLLFLVPTAILLGLDRVRRGIGDGSPAADAAGP